MKKVGWRLWLSLGLLAASAATYLLHYHLFRDAHHIFVYLLGDLAFLFLDVLLVILLLERVLAQRDRQAMMRKLNMVIGTFYSEVGLELLGNFALSLANADDLRKDLGMQPSWSEKDFLRASAEARSFDYEIKVGPEALGRLQQFLIQKRPFLLTLMENPNLLEHERFTDLLWAVFHLAEELAYRGSEIARLPESDYAHLRQDLKRAYAYLVGGWIAYVQHLKASYPYLFSLAVRVNPFGPSPSPVVR